MVDLLIIADDFTGALDTGVQFAARGAATSVITDPAFDFAGVNAGVRVLVLDAETRHLAPERAYALVRQAAARALDAGIRCIYKKTDSALRGNVGAELAAVLDVAGADRMPFVPAFPKIRRITRDGIHFIDGVPVAQSVFGQDPFDPVRHSRVSEILGEQTAAPVIRRKAGDPGNDLPGIQVFDAASDEDLAAIGRQLGAAGVRLSAGCAGFAAVVADLLALEGAPPQIPELHAPFFVVCGSVNPVTIRQLDAAEQAGFPRHRLLPEEKLLPEWLDSAACAAAVQDLLASAKQEGRCILDSNDPPENSAAARDFAAGRGMDIEEVRIRISGTMGGVMKRLLDSGLEATLMCSGGYTLLALMRAVAVAELIPVCELATGVVLTYFVYRGKTHPIIAKSGGFGEPDLLCRLEERICTGADRKAPPHQSH